MLYDRWRETAKQFQNEIALRDLSSGQHWTFKQLADDSEGASSESSIIFPQGSDSRFIFAVLCAWRDGRVLCPLEVGQSAPSLSNVPEWCVHLKLTSATTGGARTVAFRPEQLIADAANIVATMGLRPDWPNLGVISLAHSYGFSNLVLPLLLHGIPLILAGSPLPEPMRQALEDVDAATLPAVPALWRTWNETGVLSSKIKLAISAGAPLPVPLEKDVFRKYGIKIHNFYGSSECGGIAYDASETPREDSSLAGSPMKNVSVVVGESGCLEVRGRAVGETYWPELSENLGDGCFRTSDLAELIDNKVYLRGRVSDQINVAGRKVSPESVERALLRHPEVRDCLVFGVPSSDAERTDQIVACVASRNAVDGDSLKQFLLAHLPAWQIPRDWWFVESLQTNQRGKLSRAEWRRKFLEKST